MSEKKASVSQMRTIIRTMKNEIKLGELFNILYTTISNFYCGISVQCDILYLHSYFSKKLSLGKKTLAFCRFSWNALIRVRKRGWSSGHINCLSFLKVKNMLCEEDFFAVWSRQGHRRIMNKWQQSCISLTNSNSLKCIEICWWLTHIQPSIFCIKKCYQF